MTPEAILQLERHQLQRDAHDTVIQSLKYPGTVHPIAVKQAKERIEAFNVLAAAARRMAVNQPITDSANV